jgi:hypothetical protein
VPGQREVAGVKPNPRLTIAEYIERIYNEHPSVKREVRRKAIQFVTLVVLPKTDVHPDYHVVVPDDDLRDRAREVIRAANRDLRCHDGADTVLCVASAQ